MPITRNHIVTYGFYIPLRILGICPIFAILLIITSIRTTPRPLVLDYPQQEIVIQDQLYVIHNEQLYNEFVKFQQTTGITLTFESISHSIEGDLLENYESTYKDEKHCLFVIVKMKIKDN